MAEARLHPRFRLSAYADVIGSEVLLGREVADISLGGLRFAGPGWEAPGRRLEMVLCFPEGGTVGTGPTVHLSGEVVRAGATDMGIKFVALSDEQRWALKKYVRPER